MRRIIAATLVAMLVLCTAAEAGLDSKKTMYVGGTVTRIWVKCGIFRANREEGRHRG
jgi:hypothetical protein